MEYLQLQGATLSLGIKSDQEPCTAYAFEKFEFFGGGKQVYKHKTDIRKNSK